MLTLQPQLSRQQSRTALQQFGVTDPATHFGGAVKSKLLQQKRGTCCGAGVCYNKDETL
jgi:hypothetical protein